MKFFFSLFVVVSILFPSKNSTAQEFDTTDIILNECISVNFSTAGMLECIGEAMNSYDARMNEVYQNLLTKLDEDEKEVLRESQRQWLKFRG